MITALQACIERETAWQETDSGVFDYVEPLGVGNEIPLSDEFDIANFGALKVVFVPFAEIVPILPKVISFILK